MIPLSRLLSTWPKYTAWSPNFFFSSSLGTPVVNISGLNLSSTDFLFWLVLSANVSLLDHGLRQFQQFEGQKLRFQHIFDYIFSSLYEYKNQEFCGFSKDLTVCIIVISGNLLSVNSFALGTLIYIINPNLKTHRDIKFSPSQVREKIFVK